MVSKLKSEVLKTIGLLIIISYYSCSSHSDITNKLILDYSFSNGWDSLYSVKLYRDGHGFLKKEANSNSLYFRFEDFNTNKIDSILGMVIEEKTNRFVDTTTQDSRSFVVLLPGKNAQPTIYYVYGKEYPESLGRLSTIMCNISENQITDLKDTSIVFESLKYLVPQQNIDPDIKFTPPK